MNLEYIYVITMVLLFQNYQKNNKDLIFFMELDKSKDSWEILYRALKIV